LIAFIRLFLESVDAIDNGITQFGIGGLSSSNSVESHISLERRYEQHTDLSSRVGMLNLAWNEVPKDNEEYKALQDVNLFEL